MRYTPEHKAETRQRIVRSASRQFRAEGLSGPNVGDLMKASGLTHGGFYKHFESRDELLVEAVEESIRENGARLIAWAEQASAGEGWKEIVKKYLSVEHCEHPEWGCPTAALAPEIARTAPAVKKRLEAAMSGYRRQLFRFMPGRSAAEKERNGMVMIAAMAGALSTARMLPDARERQAVLSAMRDHLLSSF